MGQIPVVHIHEEDFVWRPGLIDEDDTVEEATKKLAETFIGIRVKEKPGKELRITLVDGWPAKEEKLLDPNKKVKEVIEPLSVLRLIWWPRD